jgi:hypothetical protein
MDRLEKNRLRYLTATLKRHNAHGTLWRPNGAVLVNITVRFLRDLALTSKAPFDIMLEAVAKMTKIPVNELTYLSDIGEWVLLDRGVREMDDDEYEEFWENEELDLRMEMLNAPSRTSPEVEALNAIWSIS